MSFADRIKSAYDIYNNKRWYSVHKGKLSYTFYIQNHKLYFDQGFKDNIKLWGEYTV